ncbi:branched-chain amino acid ABC transporter permease [Staphylospora marina]|uniref:branched-chain amino acid ABC transporter permease n=1 Tax=Staphylospora marina TaxID=2490858 RepID=UPI000F5BB086|nr:branched-chain amino acid ABC transporter permease [Staphylospora marina]
MRALGLFTLVVLLFPWLTDSSYLLTVATFTGIYAIVAVGLGLLMGYAGQISLGQAAFFGIGAYTSAVLSVKAGFSPWLGMVAGMILPGLVAFLLGRTLSRLRGYYLAMATLAFGIGIHVLLNEWTSLTGGASGLYGIMKPELLGLKIKTGIPYYYFVWFFALLAVFMTLNIARHRIGRALSSIHGSEAASAAMGVAIGKHKMQAFVFSAMLAGLAGALFAHMGYSLSPETFGLSTSILFVTMVVLGGMRSVWGAVVGAILISSIRVGVKFLGEEIPGITSEFELVLFGLILMLVVLFLPRGLVPELKERFQNRWRKPKAALAAGSEKEGSACDIRSSV